MRVQQAFGALPNYYDRVVENVGLYLSIGIQSPHTITLRGSYTVPSGYKAIVEVVYLYLIRTATPTTIGTARISVYYTPYGGTAIPIALTQLYSLCDGEIVADTIPLHMFLGSGDTISVYTSDSSVGGTCSYLAVAKIMKFA